MVAIEGQAIIAWLGTLKLTPAVRRAIRAHVIRLYSFFADRLGHYKPLIRPIEIVHRPRSLGVDRLLMIIRRLSSSPKHARRLLCVCLGIPLRWARHIQDGDVAIVGDRVSIRLQPAVTGTRVSKVLTGFPAMFAACYRSLPPIPQESVTTDQLGDAMARIWRSLELNFPMSTLRDTAIACHLEYFNDPIATSKLAGGMSLGRVENHRLLVTARDAAKLYADCDAFREAPQAA